MTAAAQRIGSSSTATAELVPPPALLDHAEPCYLPKWWRDEVEAHTRKFRAVQARKHWVEAFSTTEWSTAVWHVRRARGQERRFYKLANCGEIFEATGRCSKCEAETVRPVHCGLVNLCPRCRGRQAQKLRTKVRTTMGNMPEGYGDLKRRWRQPWDWKLLTLTIPHGASERARLREKGETDAGVELDTADLATKVWPMFWRWLKAHVVKDRDEELIPLFVKCLEITVEPSRAGREADEQVDGHAHYHVAVFAPFLSKNVINLYWGKALAKAGRKCPSAAVEDVLAGTLPGSVSTHERYREHVERCFVTRRGSCGHSLAETREPWQPARGCIPWAVTDIRQAHGDPTHELVKYLVKDVNTKEGRRVRSVAFARAYRAVEGRRRLTSSKSFTMPEPESCRCESCSEDALTWEARSLVPPDTPGQNRTEPIVDIVRESLQRELVSEFRKWQRERRVYQTELKL